MCLNSPKALPCTAPTQWGTRPANLVEGKMLTVAGTKERRGGVVGGMTTGEGGEGGSGRWSQKGNPRQGAYEGTTYV